MITQQKAELQALSPQTWDKPTAQARVGDYIREPFQPIMAVVEKDVLPDGNVWLLAKPVSASYTQEWIIEPEPAQEPSAPTTTHLSDTPIEQPVLDYPSCELQPAPLVMQEYQKGTWWGKQDASARRERLYTEANCPHSTGYLDAYHSFMQINQQFQQPPFAKKPIEWKVVFAPDWDWDWYKTWVGDKCIGKYCSVEEGEAAAQKYIAAELARQHHRELVIAAYPG